MRRLSSKWTFFYKRIFPLLMLLPVGGAGAAVLFAPVPHHGNAPPFWLFLMIPVFLTFIVYMLMKHLILDLLDEVWEDGDRLVLVKGDIKDTVAISDILNVSDTYLINPPRITLLLRQPCAFGREIVFSPAVGFRLNPFKKSEVAQELLKRVHKL